MNVGTTSSTQKHLYVIVYDGISNSVFESQVINPLLLKLQQTPQLHATLVCFEKKQPNIKVLSGKIPVHPNLHLIICRRFPFWGISSLKPAIWQLIKHLRNATCHQIIARGPLAGYVALETLAQLAKKNPDRLRTTTDNPLPSITIQARGLCAEEYRYATEKTKGSWLKKMYQKYMYNQLKKVEWIAYRNKRASDYPRHVLIESVSNALSSYLIHHFRADASKISLATQDIPTIIAPSQIHEWKEKARKKLDIPNHAIVYCYSGSYKAWQCAQQTIAAFALEYQKNSHAMLLILTQDKKLFESELTRLNIPEHAYRILTVQPSDIYFYLSAGDYGMLLREPDVINWVSRPTKMLEYQSIGLQIIHNNTIAWLAEKK